MIYRKLTLVFAVLGFAVIGVAGSALAEKVCFQCHKKAQFSQKVVHKPLAKGSCVACHNPHVANHEGLLQENLKELCISCHEKTFDAKGKNTVIHSPVRQGKCTACHDPHSSNNQDLLKGKLTEVCLGCHQGLKRRYKNTHKPYAKGQCSVCHAVHWADNFQLLVKAPAKICRTCHAVGEIKTAHKNYPVEIDECLSCHNPHGSEQKAMVRDVLHQPFKEGCNDCHDGSASRISQETCLGCHEEISTDLRSIHNHLTQNKGNGCINCHSPHAGNTNKLLKSRQVILCRNCHDDTFRRHQDTAFIHTVTFKDCNICHVVHGNNQVAMLKDDSNSVCLGCHPDQGQFSHPVGESIRDPRNNQMTTCVSCHNPHGTNFKGQLKLSGQEDLCVQCHHM